MNRDTAQRAKPIKLQILVSDRCNLRCGHCIVSASPLANRWMLSERDIEQIAAVVNTTPEVQTVHFTGGEPTLFQDLISRLQNRIKRQVRYGMTTNGTQGSRLDAFLKAVNLDEITLSYDRFRKDQVKQDILLDFLKAAKVHRQLRLRYPFRLGSAPVLGRSRRKTRHSKIGADRARGRSSLRPIPPKDRGFIRHLPLVG